MIEAWEEGAVMDIQDILETYQEADQSERLLMFMEYREHRDEFMRLDMDEVESEKEVPFHFCRAVLERTKFIFVSFLGILPSPFGGSSRNEQSFDDSPVS
jgi:hypothetical protein